MKKEMLKSAASWILRLCAILTIFITFNSLDYAFAGGGVTLTVSCTIPVIAGLNSGTIQQQSTRPQDTQLAVQNQGYTLPKEIKTPAPSMLQADKEISKPAASPMLVQTFYSR